MPADRTVTVRLQAEVSSYLAAMLQAGAATKQLGQSLDQATKSTTASSNLDSLNRTLGVVGLGLFGAATAAVKMASDFDSAMSRVKANVDDKSAPAMARLRDAALQAGQTTQYSAIQAADAEDELAKAGIHVTDIVSGGLTGALSLAAAGNIDVASAAEIAASAMVQFGLSGQDIPHIADLLAAGADKAQGSVQDLGNALVYVGPVAHSMGMSIEETTGILTEFANAGITGERAGTMLRGALAAISSPSAQARTEMEKLGIQLYDNNGKFLGGANAAEQLKEKIGGLTGAQQDLALGMIFGNEQVTAARLLMQGGAAAVQKYTSEVNSLGFATTTAATKMDNLAGDTHKLEAALQTTFIQAGTGAEEGLRKIAQAATGAVTEFSNMPKFLQEGAVFLSGISGTALLAYSAFSKLQVKVADAAASLSAMGPLGAKAGSALTNITTGVTRLTAVLAGMQVVSAALGDDINVPLDGLAKSLLNYANTGKIAGDATQILGKDLSKFKSDMSFLGTGELDQIGRGFSSVMESISGMGRVMDDSVYHAKERMGELDKALSSMVESGHADEAKQIFQQLLDATEQAGGNLNDLTKALPQYSSAIGNMSKSAANAKTAQQDVADSAYTLASSWEEAVNAGKSLKDIFDQLNGKATNSEQALIKANDSVKKLTDSLSQNGHSLDINTEQGRANMTSVLDLSAATRDAVQAKYDETGSIKTASATYDLYVGALRTTLQQAGFTNDEINQLIATYDSMPAVKETHVSAPGAVGAKGEVDALRHSVDILQDKSFTVTEYIQVIGSYADPYSAAGGKQGGIGSLLSPNRWGGVYTQPAATGFLRDATVSPGTGPLYQWAERATGGEAFVPRLGNPARSRNIVEIAAGWYGGSVSWGSSPAATPVSASLPSSGGGATAPDIASAVAQQMAPVLATVVSAMRSSRGPLRMRFERGGLAVAYEEDARYRRNTG